MLDWLFRKRDRRHDAPGRNFTEEERARSELTRVQNAIQRERIEFLRAKLARMKAKHEEELLQDELADMEGEFDEGEDETTPVDALSAMDNPDALLAQLFMQILSANNGKPVLHGSTQSASAGASRKSLTDEELRAYKAKLPDVYVKKARKMSDEELIHFVGTYKPEFLTEYDEDTIRRACAILKEKD